VQRALGAAKEPAGPAVAKRQPSPSKVSTPPSSVQEKPKESPEVQKELTKQPAAKPAQVQDSQTTKTEVKPQAQQDTKPVSQPSKPAPAPSQPVKQNEKPSTQQPPKAGTTPAKSVTPPVQPAKQESGGFFGFGAPKTPPTAVKSAESVKGKMFGFGSSFLTSASTLITSAVQDEPKTTPPTPRKMSTTGSVSPKITPPVSPKMAPAKDTKPPVPPKPTEAIQSASKAGLSTCPLCKVELNVGSKDPPNYNTCTECKNTVCNLCGFNPMPHTAAVSKEWLCLNCQTQRALSGQLVDAEKMPQPVSTKPEKTEPKPAPAKAEPTAGATRSQPVAKPSDAPKDDLSVEPSMPLKTEVKTDRRRLSFQPMDESSESEITPSPSPKVQRRRLQVTNVSSSSEDLKT
uniref:Zinc finger piccolo-type domain-containing protein n=1 Tax=Salarias fasciatus TaxID=181472 RepID=A0A672GPB5_SALFA